MGENVAAFEAFNYTLIALNSALVLLFLHARVERWNREMGGLIILLFAAAFALALGATDPFRFKAADGGYLTLSYYAGLSFVSNMSLALVVAAYGCLAASWVSLAQSTRSLTWQPLGH